LSYTFLVAVESLKAGSLTILDYLRDEYRKLNDRQDINYPGYSPVLFEVAEAESRFRLLHGIAQGWSYSGISNIVDMICLPSVFGMLPQRYIVSEGAHRTMRRSAPTPLTVICRILPKAILAILRSRGINVVVKGGLEWGDRRSFCRSRL
jgi:hypothetical protein